MAAMARAAETGGAVAIRANGPEDIAAIKNAVSIPVIGIYKDDIPGYNVRITPTLEHAKRIAEAGADLIAIDATARPRPGSESASEFIKQVSKTIGRPVVADISNLCEGLAAAKAGADVVATTLSGYTYNSQIHEEPDYNLIRDLASVVEIPLIAEGRIATPAQAERAITQGAYAVVVGGAITRPQWITRRFVDHLGRIM